MPVSAMLVSTSCQHSVQNDCGHYDGDGHDDPSHPVDVC
jgi:hypothetical protein